LNVQFHAAMALLEGLRIIETAKTTTLDIPMEESY